MAKIDRPGKGQSLLCLPRDYTVVDTETTGLSSETCSLIEVSALRVRGGQVQEEFSTLIRPPWREVEKQGEWIMGYVDDFIHGHHRRDVGGRPTAGGRPAPGGGVFGGGFADGPQRGL